MTLKIVQQIEAFLGCHFKTVSFLLLDIDLITFF